MAVSGECVICGGGDFMLSDGLFFCSECGTQSQHVREELTAKDDTLGFVRTIKMSAVKKEPKQNLSEGDVTIVEKFQLILQLQCDALIELGFDSSVKEAVRLIWLRYLNHCGYAFKDSPEPNIPSHKRLARLPNKGTRPKNFTCTTKASPSKLSRRVGKTSRVSDIKRAIDFDDLSESEEPVKTPDRPNPLDEFPDDAHLFDESVMDQSMEDVKPLLLDVDSYHTKFRRQPMHQQKCPVQYLCLRHTVIMCYLGLLYTHQPILLNDFTRLIELHKIPYHNVLSLLPRSYFLGENIVFFRSHINFDPKMLYLSVKKFCVFVPLPLVPPIKASQVCHSLLEKLHLPSYLHSMVDRFLRCVYCPTFDVEFRRDKPLFEMECTALIIYLLKMIYQLDDIYEFEMVEMVRDEESPEDEAYVYLWEDWMALYQKHKLASLSNAVPSKKSELSFVTDPSKFVEFCRDGVFYKARAYPTHPERLRHWNPELYQGLSQIFRQASKNSADSDPATESRHEEQKFRPLRKLYIADLLRSSSAPWKRFICVQREWKTRKLHYVDHSHSFLFLLEACCDLLGVSAVDLNRELALIDSQVLRVTTSLKNVSFLMSELYNVDSDTLPFPNHVTLNSDSSEIEA